MKNTKRTIHFRRKREGRTDYRTRLSLLKSRLPRLVIRKSNMNITVQVIEYDSDGDKVLKTFVSSNLKKLGWKHSTKNLPAAYLIGLQLGKSMKHDKELIVDIGLQNHKKGSKLYAVVKGVIDGGLKVRCSKDIFPKEERIIGKHISDDITKDFEIIKKKIMD